MSIRAGDTVLHKPTAEHWLVALDVEDDRRVYYCGYPFGGYADASECERIEEASDEERLKTLRDVVDSKSHNMAEKARRQLGSPLIQYTVTTEGSTYNPQDVPENAFIYAIGGKRVMGHCEACRQPIVDGDPFVEQTIDEITCAGCSESEQ